MNVQLFIKGDGPFYCFLFGREQPTQSKLVGGERFFDLPRAGMHDLSRRKVPVENLAKKGYSIHIF